MRFDIECDKTKLTKEMGLKNKSGVCYQKRVLLHVVTCRKEVIMIRKFIQCKNTKERMEMLSSTGIGDWTEGELNTVMDIFGMEIPEGATKEDKWELILLSLRSKEAADIAELGHKVFADAKEEREFSEEDLERLSDLAAYVKVCGEDLAQE